MILSVTDLNLVIDQARPGLRTNAPPREERKSVVIGTVRVDYTGAVPTQADVDLFLAGPAVPDRTDLDNIEKAIRALALVQRDWCNFLKSEVRGLAVLLVNKGVITASEASALTAYDGTGAGDSMTVDDLKLIFKTKYESLP